MRHFITVNPPALYGLSKNAFQELLSLALFHPFYGVAECHAGNLRVVPYEESLCGCGIFFPGFA